MITESQKAKLAEYKSAAKLTPARERLASLFDDGIFNENGAAAAGKTPAGVVTAYGYINGCPAYAFSQDKTIMNGAVSKAHSAAICRLLQLAAKNGVPVVGVYDSCGAYINDGADALNAYSDILNNMGNLSGVVPMVSVICGVCAGSMAMIACSADYSVITESAELYVTAANAGAKAADAVKCGAVSCVAANDSEAMENVRKYLSLMPMNNLSPVPEFDFAAPQTADFSSPAAAASSLADADSLTEISAGFGSAAYTALCTIGGTSAGIAAVGSGSDKITADDCAKLSRFVRICDAYSIPVVTVIDAEGFDLESAEAIRSSAKLAGAYAEASCAKITLITGKAYGPVYIALAGRNVAADAVYAFPGAVISPVDPITAAEFLYHDKLKGASDTAAEREQIAAEYAENEASAFAAAEKAAVDDIVTPEDAREKIISVLEITSGKRLSGKLPKKHSILPL